MAGKALNSTTEFMLGRKTGTTAYQLHDSDTVLKHKKCGVHWWWLGASSCKLFRHPVYHITISNISRIHWSIF